VFSGYYRALVKRISVCASDQIKRPVQLDHNPPLHQHHFQNVAKTSGAATIENSITARQIRLRGRSGGGGGWFASARTICQAVVAYFNDRIS
jgi:hypothetical protein